MVAGITKQREQEIEKEEFPLRDRVLCIKCRSVMRSGTISSHVSGTDGIHGSREENRGTELARVTSPKFARALREPERGRIL